MIIGLLLSTLAAVGVVVAVALPHLTEGSRLLTPDGEHLARRIADRARALLERVREAVARLPFVGGPGAGRAAPARSAPEPLRAEPTESPDRPLVIDLTDPAGLQRDAPDRPAGDPAL